VIDCCSRRVAGWAIAEHTRTELVEVLNDHLLSIQTDGVLQRPLEPEQYPSKDFVRLCKELGVTQSMGAVGANADNSLAESFSAALKREVLQDNTCWIDAPTCRVVGLRIGPWLAFGASAAREASVGDRGLCSVLNRALQQRFQDLKVFCCNRRFVGALDAHCKL